MEISDGNKGLNWFPVFTVRQVDLRLSRTKSVSGWSSWSTNCVREREREVQSFKEVSQQGGW